MIVGIAKETAPGERRVALVPEGARALVREGVEVRVEAGAGEAAGFADADYEAEGARIESDVVSALTAGDCLLRVQGPDRSELRSLPEGAFLVALLRPLDEPELARAIAERNVSAFALELMPRITRAQSMDVLSSQATVAGYRAVVWAAYHVPRMFPMLVTAAGTISPARAFVIGAGVAGLQAIATAKRLGAVVEAYDTRPAVAEQVESLGARFVELELESEEAEGAGGYARAQSEEFYKRQREAMAKQAAGADVVVTTALVPGRRAPLLLEEAAVDAMRPGAALVDLAAPNGGNCAVTRPEEVVERSGVSVYGPTNLPSDLPGNASQMFSRNVVTFLRHLVAEGELRVDLEDEITRGALLAHEGEVKAEAVRERLQSGAEE